MAQRASKIGSIDPSSNPFEVVLSDTVDFERAAKALYIGSGGDVRVWADDAADPVTFVSVPDGYILPVRARRIFATGTTASNIIGL